MKNFKRIISFAMAMIIFASFCLVNCGAVPYRFCPLSERYTIEYFSTTSAYAYVYITDWAEEENTTDLSASTYAFVEDYDYWDNFENLTVSVKLAVWLDDGSDFCLIRTDSVDATDNEVELEAFVSGQTCLDSENHYPIEYFDTEHEVVITLINDNDLSSNYYDYVNDGPVICIGPEY